MPRFQRMIAGNRSFFRTPCSHQMVVHKVDFAPPAGLVDVVQFRDDLGGGFDARTASEQGRDITKFALVGVLRENCRLNAPYPPVSSRNSGSRDACSHTSANLCPKEAAGTDAAPT